MNKRGFLEEQPTLSANAHGRASPSVSIELGWPNTFILKVVGGGSPSSATAIESGVRTNSYYLSYRGLAVFRIL